MRNQIVRKVSQLRILFGFFWQLFHIDLGTAFSIAGGYFDPVYVI